MEIDFVEITAKHNVNAKDDDGGTGLVLEWPFSFLPEFYVHPKSPLPHLRCLSQHHFWTSESRVEMLGWLFGNWWQETRKMANRSGVGGSGKGYKTVHWIYSPWRKGYLFEDWNAMYPVWHGRWLCHYSGTYERELQMLLA